MFITVSPGACPLPAEDPPPKKSSTSWELKMELANPVIPALAGKGGYGSCHVAIIDSDVVKARV